MKRLIGLVAGMLIVLSLVGLQSASASLISGGVISNMPAGKNPNSNVYLPISGDLGEYGVGAGGTAGTVGGSLTLGAGGTAKGNLSMRLTYNLASPIDPANSALLAFHVTDLDFLRENIGGVATHYEWVSVGFTTVPFGPPTRILETITSSNYTSFRIPAGVATNNTPATYALDLHHYFTDDELSAMTGFQIVLNIHSYIERIGGGSVTFIRDPEGVSSDLTYSVPEPATIALLLAGVPMMLRRRRAAR